MALDGKAKRRGQTSQSSDRDQSEKVVWVSLSATFKGGAGRVSPTPAPCLIQELLPDVGVSGLGGTSGCSKGFAGASVREVGV